MFEQNPVSHTLPHSCAYFSSAKVTQRMRTVLAQPPTRSHCARLQKTKRLRKQIPFVRLPVVKTDRQSFSHNTSPRWLGQPSVHRHRCGSESFIRIVLHGRLVLATRTRRCRLFTCPSQLSFHRSRCLLPSWIPVSLSEPGKP